MKRPYAWHPSIIDTQLLRIGDFVVAALPGEFTTMSGRRMRNMLKASLPNLARNYYYFKHFALQWVLCWGLSTS